MNKLRDWKKEYLKLAYELNAFHISPSLSIFDILYISLDFCLKKNCKLVISKGHCALAFYYLLYKHKKIKLNELNRYNSNNSNLHALLDSSHKHVEITAGSLGHGPGIALGMAKGYKIKDINKSIILIIGDGEINEGSVLESLILIGSSNYKNLITIIDKNNYQALCKTKKINKNLSLNNFLESIGFTVISVNGHNLKQLEKSIKIKTKKPKIIIAETKKGFPISFMMKNNDWHYKKMKKIDLEKSYKDIDLSYAR